MSKRLPSSTPYHPWLGFDALREALVNQSMIPAEFYDRTLIQNFIESLDALTPDTNQLRSAGFVDYRSDGSMPVFYTCMVWESKAAHDAYYLEKAVERDAYHSARDALLSKFNLKLESKTRVVDQSDLTEGWTASYLWMKYSASVGLNEVI